MGVWDKILQGLETVDSYTGVPVRTAVDETLKTGKPGASLYKGMQSFGVSPKDAPTGKDILEHAGMWEALNSDLAKDFMASAVPGSSAVKFSPSLYKGLKDAMPHVAAGAVEAPLDLTNLIPAAGMLKKAGNFSEVVGDLSAGARKVLASEVGAFDPKDLLKILRRGSDNVYDMEKARNLKNPKDLSKVDLDKMRAAEEVEINSTKSKDEILEDLAQGFMDDLKNMPQPTDEEMSVIQAAEKKISSGEMLSPEEESALFKMGQRLNVKNVWNPIDTILDEHEILKEQAKTGNVTSLNVEKGAAAELPEAGKLIDTVRENTGDKWVGGLRKGGIFKAKSGPLKDQEFTVTGRSKPGSEETGWNAVYEAKTKDGKSHWFNSSEMYWQQRPDSDPYSMFASPEALAAQQERLKKIGEEMKAFSEREKLRKAAELERQKKAVVGVDFGVRKSKAGKAAPQMTTAELAKHGREWLSELEWGGMDYDEAREAIAELTDEQVLKKVNKHWDGGLDGFKKAMGIDTSKVKSLSPLKKKGDK